MKTLGYMGISLLPGQQRTLPDPKKPIATTPGIGFIEDPDFSKSQANLRVLASPPRGSFFYSMKGEIPASSIFRRRSPLYLAVGATGIFVVWAIFNLNLPLFWDEIGVYGRGIFAMIDNKVSLHPDALPPDISRGHPLLFTYLIAGWTRIFGVGIVSMRTASLVVSIILLAVTFCCVRQKHEALNPIPGLLVLIQPIFLAQSTLILPEMMLTMFTMIAVVAFLRRAHWLFFLAGSAMILTKETGIVLVAGFGLYDVVSTWFQEKRLFRTRFVYWALPVIPYAIFLLVQKQTHGWYFFPYHTDGFQLAGPAIERNLKDFLSFIFLKQGRYLWLILLAGIAVSRLIKKDSEAIPTSGQVSINGLLLILSGIYLAFYSTTYYMNRYMLVVIIMVAIVLGRSMVPIIRIWFKSRDRMVLMPLMLILIVVQLSFLNSRTFKYDEDMAYKTYVEAQQEAIDFFLEKEMHQEGFHVGFPLDFALLDPRYGYLPDSMERMLNYEVRESTKHILNIVPPGNINNPQELPIEQDSTWRHGYAEIRYFVMGGK